ncbi:Crotonase core [Penicillium freii]|nr:Crotonase core [Penicillium freii]
MAEEDLIRLNINGIFAVITLNNPTKFNALTQSLYYRLTSLLREAEGNPDIYVTILISEGPFFSAAFYSHSKILITALNRPIIRLSAALISHSDFIYAISDAYLITPFTSLGLIAEGGSSIAFVQRIGQGKANEALLLSRKIPISELAQVGFVNKVFEGQGNFREQVIRYLQQTFGDHLVKSSLLGTKALIRRRLVREQDKQAPLEIFGSLDRFYQGIPQAKMSEALSKSKTSRL